MHRQKHTGNRGIHKAPKENNGGLLYFAFASILAGSILLFVFGG